MSNVNIREIVFQGLFISIFIFLYFMFFFYFYIFPKDYSVSFVLFIGFAIIIIGFFVFVNLNHEEDNKFRFLIRFLSEDSIKIILMTTMCICLFINPISSPKTIILWSRISILNYIRGFTFIIGCLFLPGANLYNIFFPKKDLHIRFNIESFLLKISLYPLLSLAFIGISVLILDQMGLIRELFEIVLFSFIMTLFFLDFLIKKLRRVNITYKVQTINLSKYSIVILIISIGVIFISLGTHLGMHYLIPGDSWIGLAPNNYIGSSDSSPIKWGITHAHYPIFWSYISFGLSVLSGLPYFNLNALLAPFCYLYITLIYLLTKAILYNFKEKYSVLSTLLISISSSLLFFGIEFGHGGLPGITYICEFYFIYKTYSNLLFIFAVALFINTFNMSSNKGINTIKFEKNVDSRLLILSAFFLIISGMLYMIPLLIGLVLIFLYFIFSIKKRQDFRFLTRFFIYLIIIFILLDSLMSFYLSESIFSLNEFFFRIGALGLLFEIIPPNIFIYLFFCCLLISITIIKFLYIKFFENQNNFTFNLNAKKAFKYSLFIFTSLLMIEIIVLILQESTNLELIDKYLFLFYLDLIFTDIGFIGIIGVFLSYFSYRKDKKMWYVLIFWIVTLFTLASFLIYFNWINNSSIFLKSINKRERFMMIFWYNRIWNYSIIPLCILTSIGLIKISKKIKNHQIFNKIFNSKNKQNFIKLGSLSFLIFLSYTNLIFAGIWAGNKKNRPTEEQVRILGWMSENIEDDSNILINEDYIIRVGIFSMVNGEYYFIDDIFDSDNNMSENIDEIEYLIEEEIKYLLIHEDDLYENSNRSRFIRNYLKPYFYNESEYETKNYRLYYAPYFD